MPCQCEIFEVCPECVPPEEYTRISRMRDRALAQVVESVTTERRYTLDEFEALAKQWRDEFQVTDGGTEWAISHLIQWLKKREREVGVHGE